MEKGLIRTAILLNSAEEARVLGLLLGDLQINLDIVVANHIDQFISIISKEKIDCFILDWKFEHHASTDLIAKIRKNSKYRQTPIVVVVDKLDELIPMQYSALKIDMLITRPFKIDDFHTRLITILNKKSGHIIPEHFEVLALDDSPEIIRIHEDNLKELQHLKFNICSSVAEAKKLINEKDYDLFLLDWNLDDGTCLDLIEFIRSKKDNVRLNEALIIAVTGRDDVDDIMTLLKYGVKDYIIKPFDFPEFEDKLIYALERHHQKLKRA